MESATFEMTPEQLREKCPLPAILHWEQNHFVVLTKVSRSRWTGRWRYTVANPAYGIHTFAEKKLPALLAERAERRGGGAGATEAFTRNGR